MLIELLDKMCTTLCNGESMMIFALCICGTNGAGFEDHILLEDYGSHATKLDALVRHARWITRKRSIRGI